MVGWHHRLNGHEFEQASGDVKDREGWHAGVHRVTESDMTEWLNDNSLARQCQATWLRLAGKRRPHLPAKMNWATRKVPYSYFK